MIQQRSWRGVRKEQRRKKNLFTRYIILIKQESSFVVSESSPLWLDMKFLTFDHKKIWRWRFKNDRDGVKTLILNKKVISFVPSERDLLENDVTMRNFIDVKTLPWWFDFNIFRLA